MLFAQFVVQTANMIISRCYSKALPVAAAVPHISFSSFNECNS